MRRGRVVPILLAVVLSTAACGSDAGPAGSTAPLPSTSIGGDTPSTPSPGNGPTTSTLPGETTTTSDREVAPDFTLELGDGGEYTLSEGEKPVYLVFWAEW